MSATSFKSHANRLRQPTASSRRAPNCLMESGPWREWTSGEGVKLEEQILITEHGVERLSVYGLDDRLLG